jgi:hypothetical protein
MTSRARVAPLLLSPLLLASACAPGAVVHAVSGAASEGTRSDALVLRVRAIARSKTRDPSDPESSAVRPTLAFVKSDDDRVRVAINNGPSAALENATSLRARVVEITSADVVDRTEDWVPKVTRESFGDVETPTWIINASLPNPIVLFMAEHGRTGVPVAKTRRGDEWEHWSLSSSDFGAGAFSFVSSQSNGMPRVWVNHEIRCADRRQGALGNCGARYSVFRALVDDGADLVAIPEGTQSLTVLETEQGATVVAHVVEPWSPRARVVEKESVALLSRSGTMRLALATHPDAQRPASTMISAGKLAYLLRTYDRATPREPPSIALVNGKVARIIGRPTEWGGRELNPVTAVGSSSGALIIAVAPGLRWERTPTELWMWTEALAWERIATPAAPREMKCAVQELSWKNDVLWATERCDRESDLDRPDHERMFEARLLTTQAFAGTPPTLTPIRTL